MPSPINNINDGKVFVNISVKDSNILITVTDEGRGIPDNEIEKLFYPFSKTSTRGTMGEKGSGLGLAIVHKIVESHKGKIQVESKLGKGSKFIVSLPINLL